MAIGEWLLITEKRITFAVVLIIVTSTTLRSVVEVYLHPWICYQDETVTVPTCVLSDRKAKSNDNKELNVFPNPSSNVLNVENIEKGQSIYLRDVIGNVILETKATGDITLLNIDNVAPGFYILEVKGFNVKKVIKIQ